MKKDLHPNVNTVEVTCTTCANKFEIKTTSDDVKVDVCASCHPFYTGKQTSGAKAGRIDKFNQRMEKKQG